MARRTYKCPSCKKKTGVDILYGYPDAAAGEAEARGEIVLGGCGIEPGQPDRKCLTCGHAWAVQSRRARRGPHQEGELPEVVFRDGITTQLTGVRVRSIRDGVLEFAATRENCEKLIDACAADLAGVRKNAPHVVRPVPKEGPDGKWALPGFVIAATLMGSAISDTRDGSHLAVVFFLSAFPRDVVAAVADLAAALGWREHAEDYDW